MKTKLLIIINILFVLKSFSQNTALHFDGIDDYVELPSHVGNFDFNQDFTISIWIKPDIEQTDTRHPDNDFLEKWNYNGPYPFVLRYLNKTAGVNEGCIIAQRYDARFDDKNRPLGNPTIQSTIKINDGKWHNIIFIKDRVDLKLYIDGKPAGNTIDNTQATTKNNSPLYIGKRGPNNNYFKGEIDHLNIWRYANYSAINKMGNLIANLNGLVASYNFDNGKPNKLNNSTNILFDYYFYSNNGRIMNFALDGEKSNFVLNPIAFKDTSVITFSILSPLGIVNGRKNVSESEVFISAKIKTGTYIEKVFVNDSIIKYDYNSSSFSHVMNLPKKENIVKIKIIDRYGKKTQTEFTVVKDVPQINTTLPELPKIEIGRRIALVIGNSDYKNASKLKNPVNDAKLMTKELTNLGFQVDTLIDGTKAQIRQAITKHKNELLKDSKTTGLFYYAGHGIQDKKHHNYIVPVEANMNNEDVIEDECYDIERLLLNLKEAKNDLNIVILDACRNNPFARTFRGDAGGGLAAVKTPAKGTFIAYATEPGNVADDGKGENGLYTEALVKALREPRLKIEEVFKLTREEVYKNSNEKQLPWDRAFFLGNFYFNLK